MTLVKQAQLDGMAILVLKVPLDSLVLRVIQVCRVKRVKSDLKERRVLLDCQAEMGLTDRRESWDVLDLQDAKETLVTWEPLVILEELVTEEFLVILGLREILVDQEEMDLPALKEAEVLRERWDLLDAQG